jgi:hypothetical protein
MSSRLAILIASAVILVIFALVGTNRHHSPQIGRWQIAGRVGPDSLVRALTTRIGGGPDTLGSCGLHRIRIVYVNAPIDLPLVAWYRKSVINSIPTIETHIDAGDPDFHNHVAEAIANAAWFSGARDDAIDTVTVKLVQKETGAWPDEGASSYSDFNFLRDPNGGQELVRVEPIRHPCPVSG